MFKKSKTVKLLLMTGVLLITLLYCREAKAKDLVNVSYEVTRRQDEAREMLQLINEFRTGETWYWNKDNKTKTLIRKGELKELKYDGALERTAMRRAEEIALYYEHTRPNGKRCFSIFPKGSYKGENLAYGGKTIERVHEAWKEEDLDYAGQGHRRNLLGKNYNYVGIGCVAVNGVKFWAQAFSDRSSGELLAPGDNRTVIVSADLKRSYIKKMGFMMNDAYNNSGVCQGESYSPEAVILRLGENRSLADVKAYVSTAENMTTPILGVKIKNTMVDEKIASLSEDGVLTGKSTGSTKILYEGEFLNENHREYREVSVADEESEIAEPEIVSYNDCKEWRRHSRGTKIGPKRSGNVPKLSIEYLRDGQVSIKFRQPKGGRYIFFLADNKEMKQAFRFSSGKLSQSLSGLKRGKRYFIRVGIKVGNKTAFSEVKEFVLR